ncbi:tRNA guanosine(34) transglycosylase Tgt [Candidatus Woesearchaeota archaeon]|nr:tRNA guanosine(34) transglycosylase Tgt [Candidatus Woesearchaeota archaeon]
MSHFKITHKSGNARIGVLKTKSGEIETPFFMPVVTKATGKYITTDDYKNLGVDCKARAVICNSLLLSLRPGLSVMQKTGGIHKFMNFSGVVFTDCGGFQASSSFFELKSKKGIHFRSPYDKKKIILTPKLAMKNQWEIDSDVAMMLDDMTPYGITEKEARIAMENTHKWGLQSLEEHKRLRLESSLSNSDKRQLLFGIAQGNFYSGLREESAKFLSQYDFDGFAIGGVAIGEPSKDMYEAVESSIPFLPEDKPRYVMGLGSPIDILEMIGKGVDCFDSIYPTQNARHSSIFTKNGKIYLDKGRYAEAFEPIEKDCKCHTCQNYTKAYIQHLTKIGEPAAHRLKSIHNQYFLQKLIEKAKQAIKEGKYQLFLENFKKEFTR